MTFDLLWQLTFFFLECKWKSDCKARLNKATESSGDKHHDGGFYAAFEVGSVEVPKTILELPGFIMKLDDIKRLTNLVS